MLTKVQARALVLERTNAAERRSRGTELFVLIDDATWERLWGWVFFYNSAAYARTRNPLDGLAGNAPLIVNKVSHEVVETGTALPVE